MTQKIDVDELIPLKWPDGWERTPIGSRKDQGAWKKSFPQYKDAVIRELSRMGVTSVTISRQDPTKERLDPGVAVYFSKSLKEDYSWQQALGIINPVPTLDEIDSAYRAMAMKHHPDRGGDIEVFKKMGEYRKQAREWVLGTHSHQHQYCVPCDRFKEARHNLAALRLAFAAFRSLERVGVPAILERTLDRAFKTALPAHASSEVSVK